ncbi:helix-turn-helix transcriptional regulator [Amycolatopsis japonica]|uniref:helix-turn-helix transcriptional regulator n=1 Tax=Amycolatopsis japonica TaxID=208439 RepID=UPI0037F28268
MAVKDSELRNPYRERESLRHFLRSRRARLTPADVGLVHGGRRNTPGLRREEVAVLAGVSASWYTWLEQGRDIKVSETVLDSISDALRLNDIERAHLYRLTGTNPPPLPAKATSGEVSRLQRTVEALPAPAYVVDRYWNSLAANEKARSLLGVTERGYNHLVGFFTDPQVKRRYLRWDDLARQLVGQFRVQATRYAGDHGFAALTVRLCSASPRFAELWARHETRDCAMTKVDLRGPADEVLSYEQMILGFADRTDLLLMLYVPPVIDGGTAVADSRLS